MGSKSSSKPEKKSGKMKGKKKSALADLVLRNPQRRDPRGHKLTAETLASLPLVTDINADVNEAAATLGATAHSTDTAWLIAQFHNPMRLASRKGPELPEIPLLKRAIAYLEDIHDGLEPSEVLSAKLEPLVDAWVASLRRRRRDPRWKAVAGKPVTRADMTAWIDSLTSMDLDVIPHLTIPREFERAININGEWDYLLEKRGRTGERFSLREEFLRLNNWPGDQWDSGDDFESAQKRFHRRLRKARKRGKDPLRDRIMYRGLFLREGLLLNPVEDLQWFLAVCYFRWSIPDVLDVRPDLMMWRFLDALSNWGNQGEIYTWEDSPSWIDAPDPRGVPAVFLRAVSGPGIMIDLDEDVVTALPPGCRVRRLVMSARGPLGPDWIVYWVESDLGESRPILDLVESAKLHPQVVFVSDGEPADLAMLVRPFLDHAFEIPTNPLTAHSHIPGVAPVFPEHPDAGL